MFPMHTPHEQASVAEEHQQMILDGTKIAYHYDRLRQWENGERIAPITIDMALTRKCDAACSFCYAMLQANEEHEITKDVIDGFLEDSAEMGVRGISLVSDGESLLNPIYTHTIQRGAELGISMASGTNGRMLTEESLSAVLPHLTYLRFNVSAGTPERYEDIMAFNQRAWERVTKNIRFATMYKSVHDLPVTIGIQMVLMPQDADQIIPFAKLGKELNVDYAIIKHCSDDEDGSLGVDYEGYESLYPLLKEAEGYSTDTYKVVVKWNKIGVGNNRDYSRCYGPPFLIQMSGTGLVAPCGMLFNSKFAKFHIGNIVEQRWMDIWKSDRYWEVMDYLRSDNFDAKRMCGQLCIQDLTNRALNNHVNRGQKIVPSSGPDPLHVNFV